MKNEDCMVFTVEEAGRMLGLSRPTAYTAVKRGEIPAIRIGRRLLVPKQALGKLLSDPPSLPIIPRRARGERLRKVIPIDEAYLNLVRKVCGDDVELGRSLLQGIDK